jgi:CubicO group peptidase (beta-lactamase class C family)
MLETASPEQVGMSAARLAELHAAMQAFVDEGRFAGISTLIARRGQVVDARCYGMLDISANKPLRPDSIFRLASLTKPITAVAALMLFDEGHFGLDDSVSQWIPDFRNFQVLLTKTGDRLELSALDKAITFRHLLTHTAGLGYGFGLTPIEEVYAAAKFLSPTAALQVPLSELVKTLPGLPLAAQPGTSFTYSLAYDVLGYLVGLISGKPFDVFLRERIFEPLGMADTGFYVPPEKLSRFGPMYWAREDGAALTVADAVAGSPYISPDVVPSGGGGLLSSIGDYYRFASMLANGGALARVRLLQPDTFAAMTTNQLPATAYGEGGFPAAEGYGLGLGVRLIADPAQGLPAGALGWGGGSGTRLLICPREEMIVICMAQVFGDSAAGATLLKMAYAAIAD